MPKIEEALARIEAAEHKVDLSNLGLNEEDLATLIPELEKHPGIVEVNLSQNELTGLPQTISRLTHLQSLNLGSNQLYAVPGPVTQLSELLVLDLSNNKLTNIPPQIVNLSKLQLLYLETNQFSVFPEEIIPLPDLAALIFSENKLTRIPEQIKEMKQLEKLYLEANQLTVFPDELIPLQSLITLDLAANKLTAVPERISEMMLLQELYLEHNELVAIPQKITELTYLEHLDLTDNNITDLPHTLKEMPGLRTLKLNDNPLSKSTINQLDQLSDFRASGMLGRMDIHKDSLLELTIWRALFDKEKKLMQGQIRNAGLGDFPVNTDDPDHFGWASATEVLKEFIQHLSVQHSIIRMTYIPVLEKFTDPLTDPAVSNDEKRNILQTLAIALGNCGTPIVALLRDLKAGLPDSRAYEELTLEEQRASEKEALRDYIRKQEGLLSGTAESSEEMETYLDSIYCGYPLHIMANGTQMRVWDQREPCQLPSGTAYGGGAARITPAMAERFVQLFCVQYNGIPIISDEYCYLLDAYEVEAIHEDYLENKGIETKTASRIRPFVAKGAVAIREMLEENGLAAHYDNKEALKLMDIPAQIRAMQKELRCSGDLEATLKDFLNKKAAAITKLSNKLEAKQAAAQTRKAAAPEHELSTMGIPTAVRNGESPQRDTASQTATRQRSANPRRN